MSRPEQTPFQPQPPEITHENNLLMNVENNLPRDRRGRIEWRKIPQEEINIYLEKQARLLFDKEKRLPLDLNKRFRQQFYKAVYSYYLGGLPALHEKCGISTNKGQQYWVRPEAQEEMRYEAKVCFEKAGEVNSNVFKKLGRADLLSAIQNHYPNGYKKLVEDLQLEMKRQGNNYWTIDRIKQEGMLFIQEYGDITNKLCRERKKYCLLYMIQKKYPGGLKQFRVDQGITTIPLHQVNEKTGVFIDNNLISWTTCSVIAKKINMDGETTKKYLRKHNISFINGLDRNSRKSILYDQSKAIEVLEQVKVKQSSKIDSKKANEWLTNLLNEKK